MSRTKFWESINQSVDYKKFFKKISHVAPLNPLQIKIKILNLPRRGCPIKAIDQVNTALVREATKRPRIVKLERSATPRGDNRSLDIPNC